MQRLDSKPSSARAAGPVFKSRRRSPPFSWISQAMWLWKRDFKAALWHWAGSGGARHGRRGFSRGRRGTWRDPASFRVAWHLAAMATWHDHPPIIHNTCTYDTLNTQYVLTPHLDTHFCPTQLFHTQFFDTHTFPRNTLYTQHFYIHPCPTPLFHPRHFHTRLFHTRTHTPLLHTTPLHTLLSPTTLLHGTLSHTSLRDAFLAHTDPPPSLFSFLPFPSHLHLSLAIYWKKLTCGVTQSFNQKFGVRLVIGRRD